jgi:phosphoribosyl-ATP pyrophosphohydrolase
VAKKLTKSDAKANTKAGAKGATKRAAKAGVKKGIGKPAVPASTGVSASVIDRLWTVVQERRTADPAISHSARLLQRGTPKVAQKFGEEAVECIIEAVAGDNAALVCESADVLYHLLVLWVSAGVHPSEVWAELERREGVSGIAEKASRRAIVRVAATKKIP